MQVVEVIPDAEGAIAFSNQSEEDRQWGLHVGDVVQIVLANSTKYTYALYCGRGRVIHVWSPSRQSFRVRVDTLRSLQASGYVAMDCSRELDEFFHALLNIAPVEPADVIRRAKTALHATPATRVSNLSFVLFARYGDTFFALLRLLKEAYLVAYDVWMLGTSNRERPHVDEFPLNLPVRSTRHTSEQSVASTEPAIKVFFGSVGDLIMSEWLRKSLSDFFVDSRVRSKAYTIPIPPAVSFLSPLLLQYDIEHSTFRVRYGVARGLPQRMAGDRMECGICWMDFTPLKVMLLKCKHYICEPCLRLLPRKKCPYCRGPIKYVQPISEHVKHEALRILMEMMALEDKPAVPTSETDQPVNANDEDEDQEPPKHDDKTEYAKC